MNNLLRKNRFILEKRLEQKNFGDFVIVKQMIIEKEITLAFVEEKVKRQLNLFWQGNKSKVQVIQLILQLNLKQTTTYKQY